jgi:hypothetical protein
MAMVIADAALVLGLVGAVTGCLGTAIALVSFARDRPKIEIRADYPEVGEELTSIPVRIANHGRQPVSVVAIGFAWRSPPSLALHWLRRLTRSRDRAFGWSRSTGEDLVMLLDPGATHKHTIDVTFMIHSAKHTSLWPCVWDSRGRMSQANRVIMSSGDVWRVVYADVDWDRPV